VGLAVPCRPFIFLCIRIGKHFQSKNEASLISFAVASATLCYIILIVSYETVPVSDYKVIWEAAIQMASGTFTGGTDPSSYFYYYNWQIGIAAFESLFVRIFGAKFLVLKILNIMILNLLSWAIYAIAKKKTSRDAACLIYILSAFFLPYLLTVSQFTNQHAALLLLLLSFVLIEKNRLRYILLAGILLGVLNVLRPMAIIAVLAVLAYWLYSFFCDKRWKPLIVRSVLFLLMYSLTITAFDTLFVNIGYADAPVSQAKIPYFKFVKGLGGDQDVSKLASFGYDYEAFNEAQKEQLMTMIKQEPLATLLFVVNKMCRYWGLFDYQFENTFNHDPDFYYQYPVKALYMISWFQYIFCIALAFIGYHLWRKNNRVDVYAIFFIGYNLVYLFIEAFSSYRFIEYPFILIMTGYAVHALGLTERVKWWKTGRSRAPKLSAPK
jgi:hypothetical protein